MHNSTWSSSRVLGVLLVVLSTTLVVFSQVVVLVHAQTSTVSEYIVYFGNQESLSLLAHVCRVENVFWNIEAALALCSASAVNYLEETGFTVYPNTNVTVDLALEDLRILGRFEEFTASNGSEYGQVPSAWSWAVSRIGADLAWRYLGAASVNVTVAVLDTGIDPSHPLLEGKLVAWIEFDRKGNPVCTSPRDTHGHGTWVSSLIAGGDGSRYVFGVAPRAKIAMAMVLPGGEGTTAQVLAGLDWALAPYDCNKNPLDPSTTGRIAVVSMSFGAEGNYSNVFLPALEKLFERGVVPVAAIGNSGPYTTSNPGNIWGVIGVGATNFDDEVAPFSSYEDVEWEEPPSTWAFKNEYPKKYTKPDLVAPGVDIVGAFPNELLAIGSGTSASTALVAGVAAVVSEVQYQRGLRGVQLVEAVYDTLTSTTDPLTKPGAGHGLVNALKAFAKASGYSVVPVEIGVTPRAAPALWQVNVSVSGPSAQVQLDVWVAGVRVYGGANPGLRVNVNLPPTHFGGNEVFAVGVEGSRVYYGKTMVYVVPRVLTDKRNVTIGEVVNITVSGLGIGDLLAVYLGNTPFSLSEADLRGTLVAELIAPYIKESRFFTLTVLDLTYPQIRLNTALYVNSPVEESELRAREVEEKVSELTSELEKEKYVVEDLRERVEASLREYNATVTGLLTSLENLTEAVNGLQRVVAEHGSKLEELKLLNTTLTSEIKQLREVLASNEQALVGNASRVEETWNRVNELERVVKSTTEDLGSRLHKLELLLTVSIALAAGSLALSLYAVLAKKRYVTTPQ